MARLRAGRGSPRPLALAAALVLLLAACGDGGEDGAASSGPAAADDQAEATGPNAPGALPAVDVVDVGSGATVALTDYHSGQRPLLVWFWAPH